MNPSLTEEELVHQHTLFIQCDSCQWWTQFENDPESASVFPTPVGIKRGFRCMNCGSIKKNYRSTISYRTFDFTKNGRKVLIWDLSTAPLTKLV